MRAGTFTLRGEMALRVGRNMSRLEDDLFTPEKIFADETLNNGWPGDWEGRAMLADALLSRLTGRESAHLERFFQKMEVNSLGYRGPELYPLADEQQLSGHNWLLRAMLEIYDWKKDPRALQMARDMVEHLYLPLLGQYAHYPVDPAQRTVGGSFAGERDGKQTQGWITSTDIGCAFMSLDGLSQYYKMFGDERVLALLKEMISVFSGIDLVGLKMQTHATLSAVRGVLCLYQTTRDPELLSLARRVFDTYRREGMSDAYTNYNWFARPEWTEPCAMVDSLIVSLTLFDITGEKEYLDFAHRAFFTGLGHAQRQNGGFGCDSCVGAGEDGDILSVRTMEAYWCCSMRGAEGLTRMAEHIARVDDAGMTFLLLSDGLYPAPWGQAEAVSQYPLEGQASVALTGRWQGKTISFFCPENARFTLDGEAVQADWANGFAALTLPRDACRVEMAFDMPVERRGALGRFTPRSRVSLWRGPLMLGADPGSALPDVAALVKTGPARFESPDGTRYETVSAVLHTGDVKPRRVMFEQ